MLSLAAMAKPKPNPNPNPVKRALLVGCNYHRTEFSLNGCLNDVEIMKTLITDRRFSFAADNVTVMTDAIGSSHLPTGANIKAALYEMVKTSKEGDILLFYFSGHGTLVPAPLEAGKAFRQHEAIVPCDLNLITDKDFRYLVNQLPAGVRFTFISDSCHSGGLIDQETERIGPNSEHTRELSPVNRGKSLAFDIIHRIITSVSNVAHEVTNVAEHFSELFGSHASLHFSHHKSMGFLDMTIPNDEGIMVSGCQWNEVSFDVGLNNETAYGAFTHSLQQVFQELDAQHNVGGISYYDIVLLVRRKLQECGFASQNPCLYCNANNEHHYFLG